MNIFSIFAAIGLLALAGLAGVVLGLAEEYWMTRKEYKNGTHRR